MSEFQKRVRELMILRLQLAYCTSDKDMVSREYKVKLATQIKQLQKWVDANQPEDDFPFFEQNIQMSEPVKSNVPYWLDLSDDKKEVILDLLLTLYKLNNWRLFGTEDHEIPVM